MNGIPRSKASYLKPTLATHGIDATRRMMQIAAVPEVIDVVRVSDCTERTPESPGANGNWYIEPMTEAAE